LLWLSIMGSQWWSFSLCLIRFFGSRITREFVFASKASSLARLCGFQHWSTSWIGQLVLVVFTI
jgi:hypothetical protein